MGAPQSTIICDISINTFSCFSITSKFTILNTSQSNFSFCRRWLQYQRMYSCIQNKFDDSHHCFPMWISCSIKNLIVNSQVASAILGVESFTRYMNIPTTDLYYFCFTGHVTTDLGTAAGGNSIGLLFHIVSRLCWYEFDNQQKISRVPILWF